MTHQPTYVVACFPPSDFSESLFVGIPLWFLLLNYWRKTHSANYWRKTHKTHKKY